LSNRRDLRLDKYEISKYAYRELLNFCRQYPEKKEKLRELRGLSSSSFNGTPRGNIPGNPTERKAMIAARIAEDCELIEQTAIEADVRIYSWLIKNVTEENLPYECLNPPIGRRQFYESRRKFFYLLAHKKGMV